MLKLITIVTMTAIAATACSSSNADVEPSPDNPAEFVELVRTKAPAASGVVGMTDDALLSNGQGTCTALRNNAHTTPALISTSYDRSWPGAGSTLVGAALTYLCPEFGSRVDD